MPPHPGLFSALGLLSTDLVYADSRSAYHMLSPDSAPAIEALLAEMEAELRSRLGPGASVTRRRSFDARILGQSWDTPFVEIEDGPIDPARLTEAFHAEYLRRNGQNFPDMPVHGVAWRVQLIAASSKFEWTPIAPQAGAPEPIAARTLRHLAAEPVEAKVYERASLGAGASIPGPAIIREPLSTILVIPGQSATVGAFGELVIEARA